MRDPQKRQTPFFGGGIHEGEMEGERVEEEGGAEGDGREKSKGGGKERKLDRRKEEGRPGRESYPQSVGKSKRINRTGKKSNGP